MNYFIDEVNVIIDGNYSEIVSIGSSGSYDPNIIKSKAIEMVKNFHPTSKLAAVIINHKSVTLEEYRIISGGNPPWLGKAK